MKTQTDKPTTTASAPETRKLSKGARIKQARSEEVSQARSDAMVKRHADAGNSSVRTIPAEKPTVESKQVVPDPVPSVLNQWTLDTETSSAFSGKRFRGNAITCNGKLVGKLVGFSEENANLVVASVNHSAKLAEALRESVSAMERMDARLLKLCDKGEIVRSKQALAAYEAAQ